MTAYRGRRAATIDNGTLRVTVLEEGGHIAEIRDLASGVNPLWTPGWPSIEPSTYDAARDTTYGANAESALLAGIMGHNLCLDIFGGPSEDEAAAGMPVHGEASVARFAIDTSAASIAMQTVLPSAQLRVERRIDLDGRTVRVRESVENLTAADRPVGWTEHVTIGPPFLENGDAQRAVVDRRCAASAIRRHFAAATAMPHGLPPTATCVICDEATSTTEMSPDGPLAV